MAKWEKCNDSVLRPFSPKIIAPYDLWPLREVIKLSIFGKPSLHTTTVASLKFLCSIVSEKSAMLKFFCLFCTNYGPLWPLSLARGNQTMHFWKALITYYHHAKFQDSVINSLWEKFNVKVLDLYANARQIPLQCLKHRLTLLSKFVKKLAKEKATERETNEKRKWKLNTN